MADSEYEENFKMVEGEGEVCRKFKSFKYADALEGCEEAIEKYMTEPNGG